MSDVNATPKRRLLLDLVAVRHPDAATQDPHASTASARSTRPLSLPLLFIEAHGEFKLVARWRNLPRWAKWTIAIVALTVLGSVL